jgi:hypothetical protein
MPASTSETELTVLGVSLESLYTRYTKGTFIVNRRYQRKLVWKIEEKQKLIDSIRRSLPIPLILLAESDGPTPGALEIIDGLQRLNAITSFIENEFKYEGKYFDLDTLAVTKVQKDQGTLIQQVPVMDRDTCIDIINYQIPTSTYRSASGETIDEVFRRINSSGKKLSLQEIRQAGVTSNLADLVRDISASIRGDATLTPLTPLKDIKKISIGDNELEYGIDSSEIFWVKNGILPKDSIRESRDEELVLDILLDIIISPMAGSGNEYRNSAYGRDDNQKTSSNIVNTKINSLGKDHIKSTFIEVIDIFNQVVSESRTPWGTWVIEQTNPRGVPRHFHATFIALYEIINSGHALTDVAGLTDTLKNFWKTHLEIPKGGGNWGANRKLQLIKSAKAILIDHFSKKDDALSRRIEESETEFNIRLHMALTETASFELKQGFTRLSDPTHFDDNMFRKVLRTASAMANAGPRAEGFIYFGVADDADDADSIRRMAGVEPISIADFFVTGTGHEIERLGHTMDSFTRLLSDKIKSSDLEPEFSSKLAGSLTPFRYKNYVIWSLHPQSIGRPTAWEEAFYVREGNSTNKVPVNKIADLFRRFQV